RLRLRVVLDLVVNHTSIDHPWFQADRRDRHSRYRRYYVWSITRPAYTQDRLVFPGFQQTSWSWDGEAGAWYHHRFYDHEPDLNLECPDVREQIRQIITFWLQRGVAGYRVDGVPFIIERLGADGRTSHEVFEDLSDLRRMSDAVRAEAVLIGEANVPPHAVGPYFGSGDRLHVMLDVIMAQHIWLAPEDRDHVFAQFGPHREMQIYGRGLRRRLATMLEGNRNRIALAFSLLLSIPGCPVILYGDEIGMGEHLGLPERLAVRTPMQWTNGATAGFSTAPVERLVRPIPADPTYAPQSTNVAVQLS